jgi:hypothetical protein
MADSSRFEGQQIVNSINFFVDSERSNIVGDTQSKGDDVHYGFEGNTIECKDGEVIRLSLVDFHMPNNQYNVDARNSQGTIICTVNGTAMTAGVVATLVDRGNYYDTDDIAVNFASKLVTALAALPGAPAGLAAHTIVNNNLTTVAILIFLFLFAILIITKPNIAFDKFVIGILSKEKHIHLDYPPKIAYQEQTSLQREKESNRMTIESQKTQLEREKLQTQKKHDETSSSCERNSTVRIFSKKKKLFCEKLVYLQKSKNVNNIKNLITINK